jgi:hypothetical protein
MVSFPIIGLFDNDEHKLISKCMREIGKLEYKDMFGKCLNLINE